MNGADQTFISIQKILQALLILGLITYFLYHTTEGNRSIFALQKFEIQIQEKSLTHSYLVQKRTQLEARVAALKGPVADGDFVEERLRAVLGYVPQNEYVIFLK